MQTDYIERVVDGDTVILEKLGRARLLGINTPETVSPAQRERGEPPQCFGPEASAEMKRLLPAGTEVEFDTDVEPLDRFGRSLVYLYKDGESINELLVRKGYARAKAYKPNIRNQEMFNRLQAEAKSESLGLWSACFDAGSSGSSGGSSSGSSGGDTTSTSTTTRRSNNTHSRLVKLVRLPSDRGMVPVSSLPVKTLRVCTQRHARAQENTRR